MKIFNYDDTGEFTGVSNAHKNPLEDGYLIPRNATTMSPPTHDTDTHRAIYTGNNQWRLERRNIVTVMGQRVDVRNTGELRKIAKAMLDETTDEIIACFEESVFPPEDIIVYRRALRKVIRGESTKLPRLLRFPKWPSLPLKGNK